MVARVVFICADETSHDVEVLPGLTLMKAAVQNGINGIDGDCGGSCNCGTCHVWVGEAWIDKLAPPQAVEAGLLEFLENTGPNSRLCCQIRVDDGMDGMILRVPPRT